MSETTIDTNSKLPSFLRALASFKDYLMGENFLGGPRPLKMAHVINLFKAGTLPFCVYLMHKFQNFGPTMMTYTALHGSYGLLWLIKEHFAPDKGWQKWITIPTILAVSAYPLGAYWVAPYLIASSTQQAKSHQQVGIVKNSSDNNKSSGLVAELSASGQESSEKNRSNRPDGVVVNEASRGRRIFASLLYGVGAAIMFGSDIQKFFVLKERPGLITNGFFSLCRHPNYLGEIMLYASFTILVTPIVEKRKRKIPWMLVGSVWSVVFSLQMMQKEARMSRHEGWEEYTKKTAFLIPYIW